MYSVITTYSFKAFHSIKDGRGFAEPRHEHDFRIELELSADLLDAQGCVIDFVELDSKVADILGGMKNRDLGSAETMAKTLCDLINQTLAQCSLNVSAVTVWEDDRHAGCYRRMS
jgi:6-pyruvoyl-tetrahydropterin synthase